MLTQVPIKCFKKGVVAEHNVQVLAEALFLQCQPDPCPGVSDLCLDLVASGHVVHNGHDSRVEGGVSQARVHHNLKVDFMGIN